ncbi:osmoprotectant transport system permease protein [Haloactinopolyspora alba]|uniref:Osmoprotectant transport system permease protein n=1 Tax=Haloactinopolyspora alba TaxID=648780 RepID=A0A2P8DYX7_9ACTN|nr:ABC transporter permease [Haloactinopolyspora alba]PSL02426.1 osmoprotectant transport system permease protein [Haloactinopolyspora alba]
MRNDWVCAEYVRTRSDDIVDALVEHVGITVTSVAGGFVLALVLAVLARSWPRLRALILGTSTVLYTVPSLVMFSLLLSVTGLTATTVIVGLILYTLTILVRGILTGLEGVPPDVREAAVGMGYDGLRLLRKVELPLAMPAVYAALRVATVSTVAMTTIGMIVGHGGLGNLIDRGLDSNFRAEVLTASVLCVVLALVADLLLVGLQRWRTPWRRGVS